MVRAVALLAATTAVASAKWIEVKDHDVRSLLADHSDDESVRKVLGENHDAKVWLPEGALKGLKKDAAKASLTKAKAASPPPLPPIIDKPIDPRGGSTTVKAAHFTKAHAEKQHEAAKNSKVDMANKLNVLMMTVDDLQYSGPEGSTHTPNLDRLVKKSLFVPQNYAQYTLSNPSRTSLLTGRRPESTRVFDEFSYWRKAGGNFTTLPQLLKSRGYHTASVGKVFSPGPTSAYDDHEHSWSEKPFHPRTELGEKGEEGAVEGLQSWTQVPDAQAEGLPDAQIARRAVEQLDRFHVLHRRDENFRFFLAVGFLRPSLPFTAPKSKFDLYPVPESHLEDSPPEQIPFPAWYDSSELVAYDDIRKQRGGEPMMPREKLPKEMVAQLRRAYAASVSFADEQAGLVLKALDARGFERSTLVVAVSDHGYSLGEGGMWGKSTLFEHVASSPLILRVPGKTDAGISTSALTELTDIFPSVASLAAGIDVPRCPEGKAQLETTLCTSGRTLLPLIEGNGVTPVNNEDFAAAFTQFGRLGDSSSTPSNCATGKECLMGYSVVAKLGEKEYRYTEYVAYGAEAALQLDDNLRPQWELTFSRELYDHNPHGAKRDASERVNVLAGPAYEEVRKQMEEKLHAGPATGGGWGPWAKFQQTASRRATEEQKSRFEAVWTSLASTDERMNGMRPGEMKLPQFYSAWSEAIGEKLRMRSNIAGGFLDLRDVDRPGTPIGNSSRAFRAFR